MLRSFYFEALIFMFFFMLRSFYFVFFYIEVFLLWGFFYFEVLILSSNFEVFRSNQHKIFSCFIRMHSINLFCISRCYFFFIFKNFFIWIFLTWVNEEPIGLFHRSGGWGVPCWSSRYAPVLENFWTT